MARSDAIVTRLQFACKEQHTMPKPTISADGGAMPAEGLQSPSPEESALAFVIAIRLAGHFPYVNDRGHFGITLQVKKPTRPAPKPNLGSRFGWILGFDDQPFAALFAHPDLVANLIAATRELETSK